MSTNLDLSLPVSTLLYTGTASAHEIANQDGASLTRGELEKGQYIRFLMMLWHVYDTLERGLEKHASHPTLQTTYNPTLLARAPSLAADISFYLQVPESSWQSHPLHVTLMSSPPQALVDYTTRLRDISDSSDPSALLSHAYVRYLGDLSGGQVIRRSIAKAYDLDMDEDYGVMFYEFKEQGSNKSATIGDLKRIKGWYRDGMNVGVGDNQKLKVDLVEEARTAFRLNISLFAAIRGPTSQNSSPAAKEQASLTPAVSQQPLRDSMVTLSSVISIVAAVGLTHFVLGLGGFTGKSGFDALFGLENWVQTIFQSA